MTNFITKQDRNTIRRAQREENYVKGLCTVCGKNKPKQNCKYCINCAEKSQRRGTRLRAERVANSLCYACALPLPQGNRNKYCPDCTTKNAIQHKNQRRIYKQNDRCVRCGESKILEDLVTCEECWWLRKCQKDRIDNTTVEQLKELWIRQDRKCALTGLPITPGKHMTIDHIIPTSKGGALGIENLQWIIDWANDMKHHHLPDDFIKYCRIVTEYNNSKQWNQSDLNR